MNIIKVKVYRKLLKEICEKLDGAETQTQIRELKRCVLMKNYLRKGNLFC